VKISRACSIGFASTFTLALIACGSADDSTFNNGGNGGGTNNDGTGSSGNPNPGGVNFGADAGGGVDSKCAESTAQAQLVPVYLVFMVDRSGSMGQDSKWPTITAGMDSFFADQKSAGLNASIQFFKAQDECNVAAYALPAVAMTALPSGTFQTTIQTFSPNGGTPTLPALQGALAYAKSQVANHPGAKVAVVLATDGVPNDCNSTVQNVTAAAKAEAATIPTYVIGVGSETQSLDAVAAGGGTNKAFIVSVGNPQQTATDFQNALNVIRGATLSCEFKLPTPPQGKTLDINTVNVVYTPGAGTSGSLTYNKDCTGGAGWHYDDANAPAKIVLCQGTCGTVQADKSGKIDIVTGCATKGGVVR
jgi:hypothetical protein